MRLLDSPTPKPAKRVMEEERQLALLETPTARRAPKIAMQMTKPVSFRRTKNRPPKSRPSDLSAAKIRRCPIFCAFVTERPSRPCRRTPWTGQPFEGDEAEFTLGDDLVNLLGNFGEDRRITMDIRTRTVAPRRKRWDGANCCFTECAPLLLKRLPEMEVVIG